MGKEYKLSGFRFDLMGLHDYNTMNQVIDNLRELKRISSSMVKGGKCLMVPESPNLLTSSMAAQAQLPKMNEIGAFNDGIRDGIKGNVFDAKATGFVQNQIVQIV